MTTLYMTFALGSNYAPQTLVGASLTFEDSLKVKDDHLRRREAPMANGCVTLTLQAPDYEVQQLLKVRNPFPLREL